MKASNSFERLKSELLALSTPERGPMKRSKSGALLTFNRLPISAPRAERRSLPSSAFRVLKG